MTCRLLRFIACSVLIVVSLESCLNVNAEDFAFETEISKNRANQFFSLGYLAKW